MRKEIISIEKDKNHVLKKILVNAITSIRALGTIVMIPIFKNHGGIAAASAAACFLLTDFIDGQLARKLKVQSFFGSLLDGLSDKAFGIICLLSLASVNPIFLLPLIGEVAIAYENYKSAEKGNNVQSSKAGKIKTGILGLSITGSFFCLEAPTLKEMLDFTNIQVLDKLLSIDPTILTTLLAVPAIAASAYVLRDYKKISDEQLAQKAKNESESRVASEIEKIESNIEDIQNQKEQLKKEQEQLKVLKTKKELLHDLFDTEFYIEHKDDGIKSLLYK